MKRLITEIIIHCAATPNGKAFTVAKIDDMHGQVKPRPFMRSRQWIKAFNPQFKHIGYHDFIEADGTLRSGRHLEEVGAHVAGNNQNSIGICLCGTDKFSLAQWQTLRQRIIKLAAIIQGKPILSADSALNAYRDMGISIKGHRDYSPDLNGNGIIERNEWFKTCPGFDVSVWIKGGMMPLKDSII